MDSEAKPEAETATADIAKVEKDIDDVRRYSEFAEMCSFLELFHKDFEIYFTFKQLSEILSNSTAVPNNWSTLHIKLLSKIKRKATLNKWTRSLHRFLSQLSATDEKILHISEALGKGPEVTSSEVYLSIQPRDRAFIFLMLLQSQCDYNETFKAKVGNKHESVQYRRQPLGQDILGRVYWMFVDHEFNFLLYREDTDEESLEFITEEFEDVRQLADKLEKDYPKDLPLKKLIGGESKSPEVKEEEDLKQINKCWEEECENFDIKPEVPESIGSESTTSEEPKKFDESSQEPLVTNGAKETNKDEADPDKTPEKIKRENGSDKEDGVANGNSDKEPEEGTTVVEDNEEDLNLTPKKKGRKSAKLDDSADLSVRRSGRSRKPVSFFTPEVKPKRTLSNNKKAEKEILKIVKKVEKDSKKKKAQGKRSRKSKNANSDEDDESDEDDFVRELEETAQDDDIELASSSSSAEIDSDDSDDDDFEGEGAEKRLKIGRNLQRHKNMKNIPKEELEAPCQLCDKSDRPEWLLLCDECDLGHHAMCLTPALLIIPDGDWFCPKCCNKRLVESLRTKTNDLETQMKEHTVKKKMEDRLKFINISMSNIISAGDRAAKDKAGALAEDFVHSYEDSQESAESLAQSKSGGSDGNNSDYVPESRLRPRSARAGTRTSGRVKSRSRRYSSSADFTSDSNPDYGRASRGKRPGKRGDRANFYGISRAKSSRPNKKRRRFIDDDSVEEELSLSDQESIPEVKTKRRAASKVVSYNVNEVYKAVDSEFSSSDHEKAPTMEVEVEECGPDGRPKLIKTTPSPTKTLPRIGRRKKDKGDDDSGEDFVPEDDDETPEEESDQDSDEDAWPAARSRRSHITRSGRNVRPTKKLRVEFSGDESDEYVGERKKKAPPIKAGSRSRARRRYKDASSSEEEADDKSEEDDEEEPANDETSESEEIDENEEEEDKKKASVSEEEGEDAKCKDIDEGETSQEEIEVPENKQAKASTYSEPNQEAKNPNSTENNTNGDVAEPMDVSRPPNGGQTLQSKPSAIKKVSDDEECVSSDEDVPRNISIDEDE